MRARPRARPILLPIYVGRTSEARLKWAAHRPREQARARNQIGFVLDPRALIGLFWGLASEHRENNKQILLYLGARKCVCCS